MTVRTYGHPPYAAVVVHGGPGAPGYMAPVAEELANTFGVIEPLQSRDSLEGQIEELKGQLACGRLPMTIIGSSWGAVLALFLASRHPGIAKKLILVGSAVFDATSSAKTHSLRMERLSDAQRRRLERLSDELKNGFEANKNALFRELAETLFDADVLDPIDRDLQLIECQYELNRRVWSDFVQLRDQNELKAAFSKIKVPVIVAHGDYDPHPLEGIEPFLRSCLPRVAVHRLERCGHYPWLERYARDRFFNLLRQETLTS